MSSHKSHQENHDHNCDHHDHACQHHDHADNHEHGCGHHDHSHDHGHDHSHCSHHHGHGTAETHARHVFSQDELKNFQMDSIEGLMQKADAYLSNDEFGKVVPLFEIALSKTLANTSQNSNSEEEIMNLKQNLAFSYGIIGEHEKSIPLWKEVIAYEEKSDNDCSDLLDDYFGIALSCEQCNMDEEFLMYIQKGLKLAKENNFEEYEASFEHELGGFYCDASDFEKSANHFKNALKIREKLNDVVGITMSKMSMGILLEEQKKLDEAKKYYESALELTKQEDYSDDLQDERAELELRLSHIQNANLKSKLLNI